MDPWAGVKVLGLLMILLVLAVLIAAVFIYGAEIWEPLPYRDPEPPPLTTMLWPLLWRHGRRDGSQPSYEWETKRPTRPSTERPYE